MLLGRMGEGEGCVLLAGQERVHLWVRDRSACFQTKSHHTGWGSIEKLRLGIDTAEVTSVQNCFRRDLAVG